MYHEQQDTLWAALITYCKTRLMRRLAQTARPIIDNVHHIPLTCPQTASFRKWTVLCKQWMQRLVPWKGSKLNCCFSLAWSSSTSQQLRLSGCVHHANLLRAWSCCMSCVLKYSQLRRTSTRQSITSPVRSRAGQPKLLLLKHIAPFTCFAWPTASHCLPEMASTHATHDEH